MKIVTFNLRCDPASDGVNAFAHRKGAILDKIEEEKPDVIGFQECREHMQSFLKAHLLEYELFGRGRGGDWSEANPIAFRKDKFALIGLETQWLSPTPFIPASRYEVQSDCPRILTHMTLEPLSGGSPIHVINTHLDHVSEEARLQGARHLIGYMQKILSDRPYPLLLMGDMNAFPDEACIHELLNEKTLCLRDETSNVEHTFHGYGTETQPRIDYIFSRDFKRTGETVTWTEEKYGVYLSDHYPVAAQLEPER